MTVATAIHRRAAVAALVLLAGTGAAAAEDTICTPEFYYNSSEATPLVIPIDAPRLAGSRVTRVDIETGAYSEHMGAADGRLAQTGRFAIINPGSMQERIDFVALDAKSGLVLHISLIDEGLPFTRMDPEGTVASGHCAFEYGQPK